MLRDFAATIISFWTDFSTASQLWIGSAILDLTGYVSSNTINAFIFYGLVLAVLLGLRAYIRQIFGAPTPAER